MFISPGEHAGRSLNSQFNPGQLGPLALWLDASVNAGPAGASAPNLWSPNPKFPFWANGATGNVIATNQLSGLNMVTFPGGAGGRMAVNTAPVLVKSTSFVVHRFATIASGGVYTFLYGANGLQLYVNGASTGVGQLSVVRGQVGGGGQSSGLITAGVPFQGCAQWDSSGGAWSHRINRAPAGSGSSASANTGANGAFGYDNTSNNQDLAGDFGEIIVYSRILTLDEITQVEGYLNAKWGV